MATEVTTIFTGSLNTTEGTRTDSFKEGDYIILIAPLLQNKGIDVEIDCFLQLEFSDNTQRLIRLDPVNLIDTNAITPIPPQFRKGNDRDLYLFILSDQPVLTDVLVVSNTDDDINEIKQGINELKTKANQNLALNTVDTTLQGFDIGIDNIGLLLPLATGGALPPVPLPLLP